MAISFIRASTIQRAKGHSVSAALAYETGQLIERLDGESVDYRNRGGVENEAHIFGTTMGLQELADKMELAENRRNSCVGRRFIMALPHELSQEGRVKVAEEFTEHLHEKYGVAGVLTIHEPDKRGSEKNHHAHLTFSDRKINDDGISFGAKVRELSDKRSRSNLQSLKERWAEICNEQLQVEKIEEKLDPTPYAQNGKIAQLHEGKRRTEIARKIEKGHAYKIPKEREYILLERIREEVLEPIKKVFTDEELRAELLNKALERLLSLKNEYQRGKDSLKAFVQSFERSEGFKQALEKAESSRLHRFLSNYKNYERELKEMVFSGKTQSLSSLKEEFEKFFKRITGKGVEESIETAEQVEKKESYVQEQETERRDRKPGKEGVRIDRGERQVSGEIQDLGKESPEPSKQQKAGHREGNEEKREGGRRVGASSEVDHDQMRPASGQDGRRKEGIDGRQKPLTSRARVELKFEEIAKHCQEKEYKKRTLKEIIGSDIDKIRNRHHAVGEAWNLLAYKVSGELQVAKKLAKEQDEIARIQEIIKTPLPSDCTLEQQRERDVAVLSETFRGVRESYVKKEIGFEEANKKIYRIINQYRKAALENYKDVSGFIRGKESALSLAEKIYPSIEEQIIKMERKLSQGHSRGPRL